MTEFAFAFVVHAHIFFLSIFLSVFFFSFSLKVSGAAAGDWLEVRVQHDGEDRGRQPSGGESARRVGSCAGAGGLCALPALPQRSLGMSE